jgi:hypothetical protein
MSKFESLNDCQMNDESMLYLLFASNVYNCPLLVSLVKTIVRWWWGV